MQNYLNKFSLSGKSAFITGACGVLGKEISVALASAGATTVLLDINTQEGKQLENDLNIAGYKSHFEFFDITILEPIKERCLEMKNRYSKIDIWVNCAYPRTNPNRSDIKDDINNLSIQSLQDNILIQLNPILWVCKIVGLIMKEQREGSIINMSSIYSVVGNDFSIYQDNDMTTPPYYPAIKGGINSLTRYFSSYFGPYNVRINTVCPGGIYNKQDDLFVKKYSEKTPLKRMGSADEVGSVVLFLASKAASYITGATIMVDGGWTAV